jgi:hypothetical protein
VNGVIREGIAHDVSSAGGWGNDVSRRFCLNVPESRRLTFFSHRAMNDHCGRSEIDRDDLTANGYP